MLTIFPVTRIPEIKKADDLGKMIVSRVEDQGDEFKQGDIAVISQKIVSKAEGRILPLSKITPSEFAETIAKETGKDPRQVEAVLRESRKIIRMKSGHLITETSHGFICANAGVDQSNVGTKRNSLVTEIAVADELASAAELVMNKADRVPVAIIRGYKAPKGQGRIKELIRPEELDLFR